MLQDGTLDRQQGEDEYYEGECKNGTSNLGKRLIVQVHRPNAAKDLIKRCHSLINAADAIENARVNALPPGTTEPKQVRILENIEYDERRRCLWRNSVYLMLE